MVLLRFLKESDKDNKAAVDEARKKFKSLYGFEVEHEIYKNDLGVDLPVKGDRDSLRKFISKGYVSSNLAAKDG